MKRSVRVLFVVLATALVSPLERVIAIDQATIPCVAAVQVVSDAGEVRGTAVLIRRDDIQDVTTFYFLTSARLFRGPDGDYQRISKSIILKLDESRSVNVRHNDVLSDGRGFVDVTILRASTTDAPALYPTPIGFNPPPVGIEFLLAGIDRAGTATTVSQRVHFESTLLVVGDRSTSPLAGCVGAPAVTANGVFGIVRECGADRSPVISLLAMARSFLERYVPLQTTQVVERR
jgi:hypothetical protein